MTLPGWMDGEGESYTKSQSFEPIHSTSRTPAGQQGNDCNVFGVHDMWFGTAAAPANQIDYVGGCFT